MSRFDKFTRNKCIRSINHYRKETRYWMSERKIIESPSAAVKEMREELDTRNDLITLYQRLLAIEVAERDALYVELQKATLGIGTGDAN